MDPTLVILFILFFIGVFFSPLIYAFYIFFLFLSSCFDIFCLLVLIFFSLVDMFFSLVFSVHKPQTAEDILFLYPSIYTRLLVVSEAHLFSSFMHLFISCF